ALWWLHRRPPRLSAPGESAERREDDFDGL
ncbi:DUF4345 family protein, partial [Pseudomonas aeruginosa]